ncbi:hypothetical protein V3C99_009534 [Haemonchus contortus]
MKKKGSLDALTQFGRQCALHARLAVPPRRYTLRRGHRLVLTSAAATTTIYISSSPANRQRDKASFEHTQILTLMPHRRLDEPRKKANASVSLHLDNQT